MLADFNKQKKLLQDYGLKTPKTLLVSTISEVEEAVKKVKTPCVLKIYSQKHLHRTEVKGVAINIETTYQAKEEFQRMIKIQDVEGVIVQEQVKGYEFVIGVKTDSIFGQVIMFGTGGTMIEIFNDVSFRVIPITKKEATDMINEVKGSLLLSGFRGDDKIPQADVALAITKVALMAYENKIIEADFNPVIINKGGVFFCDVKITL